MAERENKKMAQDKKLFALVAIISAFALLGGYVAGTQPTGAGWRYFSWHPFLMTVGFVGLMGSAALIKKIGGYTNTKNHGLLSSAGYLCALGGCYVIYTNKESANRPHLTSNHAKAGMFCMLGAVGPLLVGAILLHPDFGIAKTNKLYRKVHKIFARFIVALSWAVCFSGVCKMTENTGDRLMYGIPLLVLAPLVLI